MFFLCDHVFTSFSLISLIAVVRRDDDSKNCVSLFWKPGRGGEGDREAERKGDRERNGEKTIKSARLKLVFNTAQTCS